METTEQTQKNLSNLSPARGSNQAKKRLGRGIGSNWGKTAGKGHKGQKARKGGKVAPGFEGGQMPLYRRLPKRGFKNHFRKSMAALNLDMLNRFDDGFEVNRQSLIEAGLVARHTQYIKILGRGSLDKKLKICVHKVSESAKQGIEKAGSSLELLPIKEVKLKKHTKNKK